MSGPSTPVLTPEQWQQVYNVLTLHATVENRPIRDEIDRYFKARTLWQRSLTREDREKGVPR